MAIHADTIWEFQSSGSNDNGGGFYDRDPGTSVDYTQQTSAELTLTDLATDGGGTGLSSVTGGFTAAMVGNIIYIKSGTGFTPGWYEITAFTDTNNVTIDRSAGSSATAGTGSVGGARAVPTDTFLEGLVAGNIVYFKKDGTYTFTENIDMAKDGTAAAIIILEGYNTARGDLPTDTDMPLFAQGAYYFRTGDYVHQKYFRFTTTYFGGVWGGSNDKIIGCSVVNESSSGSARGIRYTANYSEVIDCEVSLSVSTGSGNFGIELGNLNYVSNCYIHDVTGKGVSMSGNGLVLNSIIDTCGIGVSAVSNNQDVINCTIYNCTTGIETSGTKRASSFYNNDINSCTTGISSSSTERSIYIDYNNYHNNGTDVVNVIKGGHATATDPSYTDAANGDFSNTLSANASPKTAFPKWVNKWPLLQKCQVHLFF